MMEFYDYEEIKEVGDCIQICEQALNLKRESSSGEWVRFPCPWRPGSDSMGFAVCKGGWKDHVTDEHGSILDLIANANHGGDIPQAAAWLGDYYNLTAKPIKMKGKTAYVEGFKLPAGTELVKVYDYISLDRLLAHQTLRFKLPDGGKTFRQRRQGPDGWINGLGDIEPVLYNLVGVTRTSETVYVVEGEKDADTLMDQRLVATTAPMGCKNWRESYTQHFTGKKVVVVCDNDPAGMEHGQMVAAIIAEVAEEVKILTPSSEPKGDVSDYLEEEDVTIADFLQLVELTEPYELVSDAKLANMTPFRNFILETVEKANGHDKEISIPRPMCELIDDAFVRFHDFPRRLGPTMFDCDRKTGAIRFMPNKDELFAWLQDKGDRLVEWETRARGSATKAEFFAGLRARCQIYSGLSDTPTWPERHDLFYTHDPMPEGEANGDHFLTLCQMFNPASEIDRILIKAFFASPLFYQDGDDRPLWIIDSKKGQGAGKTTLVEMCARLYGTGEGAYPIVVGPTQFNDRNIERITRRMLSKDGRKKKLFLLDNIEGVFKNPELSAMITQSSITGMSPYARTEESRPNDLTYCITTNTASVGKDLADRSFFIYLNHPNKRDAGWVDRINRYISRYRLHILKDIIAILENGISWDHHCCSRFAAWETMILAPMAGSCEIISDAWKENLVRGAEADVEKEESDAVRSRIADGIQKAGLMAEGETIWLQSMVLCEWVKEVLPTYKSTRMIMIKIKNMAKSGSIPELSAEIAKYPHSGPHSKRGLMWNYDAESKSGVQVLMLENGEIRQLVL